jgi:copper transport protein
VPCRRRYRNFAAGLLALFAISLVSVSAFAHAALISSEPPDGAVIETPPVEAALVFNEPIQPVLLWLIDPAGKRIALSGHHLDGSRLAVRLPQPLGKGSYALSWRVVSADGHPISGAVIFAIGAPSAQSINPAAMERADFRVRAAIWLVRVSLFLALFVGVGGLVFVATIGPGIELPRLARKLMQFALLIGLVVAPLSIGLQGLDLLVRPLGSLSAASTWRAGFVTSLGTSSTIAFVALVAALIALRVSAHRVRALLASAALACLGAAFVTTGHASTAEPRLLSGTAVYVHALSLAFWIGALVPLFSLLSAGSRDFSTALAGFSRVIPAPLIALVASGVVLAFVQLDSVAALWRTSYGIVLSVKLLLLALLFALAGYNRYVLTPALRDGDATGRNRFAGALIVELGLVILILATVALWRFTPPPRSLAIAPPLQTRIMTERAVADVTVTPAPAGRFRLMIALRTPDSKPLHAKEITVVLAKPDAGVESITRSAKPDDGRWTVDELFLPVSGNWTITLEVLIGDFERLEMSGKLRVRR